MVDVPKRIVGCAMAFLALLAPGCGSPAGQREPRHPPRCAALLFLGLRGSGEDPSAQLAMGSTVYPVYTALRTASRRVTGYGLPFPADRPTATEIARAAADLDRFLRSRAQRCPSERIVVAGYSAGALIVGDAMQSRALSNEVRRRLTAVVLFADPMFNPADTRTAAGGFDRRYGGSPRRPAYAEPLAGRIRSYCHAHDVVCQRSDPAANKDEHGRYVPQQTCQAIRFIESVAHLSPKNC
jgi:hypothetical protein